MLQLLVLNQHASPNQHCFNAELSQKTNDWCYNCWFWISMRHRISVVLMLSCLWKHTSRDWHPRRWWKRETVPNATPSPPEWFCIKVGSGVGRFNVSVHCERHSHKDSASKEFWSEKREPKWNRAKALLLGRTSSCGSAIRLEFCFVRVETPCWFVTRRVTWLFPLRNCCWYCVLGLQLYEPA